jgi:hypothetical protein
VTEQECLALIESLDHFRVLVYGVPVLAYTDHKPLEWLAHQKLDTGKLARWSMRISEYDVQIRHKSGTSNTDADALSRLPLDEDGVASLMTMGQDLEGVPTSLSSLPAAVLGSRLDVFFGALGLSNEPDTLRDSLSRDQHEDTNLRQTIAELEDGREQKGYEIVGDLLYFRGSSEGHRRLVVPDKWKSMILYAFHNCPLGGGHLGRAKLVDKLKARFYWKNLHKDAADYVRQCEVCASAKGAPNSGRVTSLIPLPAQPFEFISVDFVGPLTPTKSGHTCILTVVDLCTRWAEAIPTKGSSANEAARALMEKVVCVHGFPSKLLSDQGTCFTSELWSALCALGGVEQAKTPSYRAATNGACERYNGTLKQMLKCYVDENQANWDEVLPYVVFAYRTSYQSSIGCSPFSMLFGREARLPLDIFLFESTHQSITPQDYRTMLEENWKGRYLTAKAHFDGVQLREVERLTKEGRMCDQGRFKVGDKVWLHTPTRSGEELARALKVPWSGPFEVTRILGRRTYQIVAIRARGMGRRKPDVRMVNEDRLKPYVESTQGVDAAPMLSQAALARILTEAGQTWTGPTNDECERCNQGGEVIECGFCNLVFHGFCLPIPLTNAELPEGDFVCPECELQAYAIHAGVPADPFAASVSTPADDSRGGTDNGSSGVSVEAPVIPAPKRRGRPPKRKETITMANQGKVLTHRCGVRNLSGRPETLFMVVPSEGGGLNQSKWLSKKMVRPRLLQEYAKRRQAVF